MLFSAALMTLDSEGDTEFMEREERERVVAGNVVRLALAVAALASYVSLLAYVVKVSLS